MSSILAYTENGKESVNSNKVPLIAKALKKVSSKGSVFLSKYFPLTTVNVSTNAAKNAKYTFNPCANRIEEFSGLLFVKPAVLGNGVICWGEYATTSTNTFYIVVDLTGSANYNLDAVVATVDTTQTRPLSYIRIYEDTSAHNLIWTLEHFICGINLIDIKYFSDGYLVTYNIPSWVNKNNLYISVPHKAVFNNDNGTDATWAVSEIAYQIIGNVAYVRCFKTTNAGTNQPVPANTWFVFAEITNALSTVSITS